MGLSLVLVGITLLMSTWQGTTAFDTLITWWPVVFILLGVEILLFLAFKSKEQSVIHYDMFSILFVGVLCCICVGFALATASGFTQEIRYAIGRESRTLDIPSIQEAVPPDIERIIIQTDGTVPKMDGIEARELHLFGSYRTHQYGDGEVTPLRGEDVASVRTVDRTLYVLIKQLPRRTGLNDSYPDTTLTLAFPKDVPYEIRGRNNQRIIPDER
jgi:hypothetical protein